MGIQHRLDHTVFDLCSVPKLHVCMYSHFQILIRNESDRLHSTVAETVLLYLNDYYILISYHTIRQTYDFSNKTKSQFSQYGAISVYQFNGYWVLRGLSKLSCSTLIHRIMSAANFHSAISGVCHFHSLSSSPCSAHYCFPSTTLKCALLCCLMEFN